MECFVKKSHCLRSWLYCYLRSPQRCVLPRLASVPLVIISTVCFLYLSSPLPPPILNWTKHNNTTSYLFLRRKKYCIHFFKPYYNSKSKITWIFEKDFFVFTLPNGWFSLICNLVKLSCEVEDWWQKCQGCEVWPCQGATYIRTGGLTLQRLFLWLSYMNLNVGLVEGVGRWWWSDRGEWHGGPWARPPPWQSPWWPGPWGAGASRGIQRPRQGDVIRQGAEIHE